ncbi:UbiA prenyltransferase family-domain-containing protein [Mycena pura]|uniref:UbiA prenyltransferase family-domain-containing protein n=1 Tax=Mycena pura TaxID=153505 RepID=A0AAD6YAY3_9AGAR|nr:UbiA prenyltransferase family-domain-containing protein [Mycena pura]
MSTAAKHSVPTPRNLEALAEENPGILGVSYLSDVFAHEARVFWGFTWRDWSMSVIPGMMYTVAALRSLDALPSDDFPRVALTRSFIYFVLFIYSMDIANQINGYAEDRVDKPDRPIPSGLVSLKGAHIRWYITTGALLALGAAWGVLRWAALWVGITVYTNWCGGNAHWVTKNLLFMSVGSLSIVTAAWGLAAPIGPAEWRFMLLLSALFGLVASVQDIRDMEGDRAVGRRTLPLVLGARFRGAMAALICAAPPVAWTVRFYDSKNAFVPPCGALLTLAMLYMAYRVLRGRSAAYDHGTYMLLTYIYCGCVAVPMLFP